MIKSTVSTQKQHMTQDNCSFPKGLLASLNHLVQPLLINYPVKGAWHLSCMGSKAYLLIPKEIPAHNLRLLSDRHTQTQTYRQTMLITLGRDSPRLYAHNNCTKVKKVHCGQLFVVFEWVRIHACTNYVWHWHPIVRLCKFGVINDLYVSLHTNNYTDLRKHTAQCLQAARELVNLKHIV